MNNQLKQHQKESHLTMSDANAPVVHPSAQAHVIVPIGDMVLYRHADDVWRTPPYKNLYENLRLKS